MNVENNIWVMASYMLRINLEKKSHQFVRYAIGWESLEGVRWSYRWDKTSEVSSVPSLTDVCIVGLIRASPHQCNREEWWLSVTLHLFFHASAGLNLMVTWGLTQEAHRCNESPPSLCLLSWIMLWAYSFRL